MQNESLQQTFSFYHVLQQVVAARSPSLSPVAAQEEPDGAGVDASPVANSSPTLAEETADKASSPSGSANLFFDAVGEEQQNENNNNPCTCKTPLTKLRL